MHHPKSSGSKGVRSAMIPVALLCAIVTACADQQPTEPQVQASARTLPPGIARTDNVPFNKFLVAWSQNYSSSPIQTQMFAIDARQDRQYAGLYPDQSVLDFARANPGRLYINGDEPDQYCIPPYEYAGIYRAFVLAIRSADPSARVSPAGFAEPNEKCCPPGDAACAASAHSTSYAQQFYDAHIQRFGAAPPVDEWRFHDFGISYQTGDVDGWWSRVDAAAAWSVAHGAKMVLGGWGFHGWREPVPLFQEHLKQAIGRLIRDERIVGAAYWSYEPWIESPRPLAYDDGSLTPEGQTYANPLTDVPNNLKVVGSSDGRAVMRWNNTTSAWATEVEFWVQATGSSSFVYHKTEFVPKAGADQTPVVAINAGGLVKGRVRYVNAYGQAAWSSFSNAATITLPDAGADQGSVARKRPIVCFLKLC